MLDMNRTRTDRERQTDCDKNVTHVANMQHWRVRCLTCQRIGVRCLTLTECLTCGIIKEWRGGVARSLLLYTLSDFFVKFRLV